MSGFEQAASQWPDWLKDEQAMARVARTFERSEFHDVHWSRLTPEYQLTQVALAFWALTREQGKTEQQAPAILSDSAGRLYNPDAVNAMKKMCESGALQTQARSNAHTENGEAPHSLETWHAKLEEFERQHPHSEALFRFLFRCSILFAIVMFGWYGIEAARYFSHLIGFPVLFLTFLVVYGAERIAELAYFQRRRVKGQVYDGWGLYLLAASHMTVVGMAAIECLRFSQRFILPVALLGYIGFIGSTLLRWWTIAALGPYESAHIEVREPHPLVTTGPYKYLRHPRYFANVIEVASIPLIANSWYALGLALLIYLPLTLFRVVREEAIMSRMLGPAYDSYRNRVRLWPTLRVKG